MKSQRIQWLLSEKAAASLPCQKVTDFLLQSSYLLPLVSAQISGPERVALFGCGNHSYYVQLGNGFIRRPLVLILFQEMHWNKISQKHDCFWGWLCVRCWQALLEGLWTMCHWMWILTQSSPLSRLNAANKSYAWKSHSFLIPCLKLYPRQNGHPCVSTTEPFAGRFVL